jgi:SWI/SNF-related matrix-associated actin-dependent regulator of chromatin subfamily A member 5
MLDKFGIDSEGIHERLRDAIRESPLFRFDWFFLSRTPVEISRRCTTLLNTVMKEFESGNAKINGTTTNGTSKRKAVVDDEEEEEEEPVKKKLKNGVKVSHTQFICAEIIC